MSDEHLPPTTKVEPTAAELAEQVKKLLDTNARLLEESKKNKEKYKLTEAELERIAEENNGKEKDVNKLIEAANKKAEKVANENKKLKSETLNSRIRASLSKVAPDVNDLDDLLNQPKYADILKRAIDVDELTVDDEVVKEYAETVLKVKPYLKKQPDATTMMTKKPGFNVNEKGKGLAEMTSKEIEEMAYKLYGNK